MLAIVRSLCQRGVSPKEIAEALPWPKTLFWSIPGTLNSDQMVAAMGNDPSRDYAAVSWFTDDDDLIHRNGETIAFSSRWFGRAVEAMELLRDHFASHNILIEQEN